MHTKNKESKLKMTINELLKTMTIPVPEFQPNDCVCDKCTYMPESDTYRASRVEFPSIERVIYKLKETESTAVRDKNGKLTIDAKTKKPKRKTVKLANPVLATTIYFSDNTKVSVKNTLTDAVQTETVYIDNKTGIIVPADKRTSDTTYTEVTAATESAKERGLVYAIVKRLAGKVNDKGIVEGDGLGRKLRDEVAAAYDQDVEAVCNKIKHNLSVADHKAKQAAAKPKTPRPSLAETVERLAATVEALDKKVNKK